MGEPNLLYSAGVTSNGFSPISRIMKANNPSTDEELHFQMKITYCGNLFETIFIF